VGGASQPLWVEPQSPCGWSLTATVGGASEPLLLLALKESETRSFYMLISIFCSDADCCSINWSQHSWFGGALVLSRVIWEDRCGQLSAAAGLN